MNTVLQNIYPEKLWQLFAEICRIPHGSGNEKQLAGFISGFADRHGFRTQKDSAGNLILKVPASTGFEKAPVTVLQAHLDMVCEKESGSLFDFMHDPITPVRDGLRLKARNTTLGADNGIGVAGALAAAMQENSIHGPLELLFTVEEESGMTGASALSADFLTGRLLINLDSEETGAIYIGCAGGGGVTITLPLQRKTAESERSCAVIAVDGLCGGHSGLDIDKNRANAIVILARFLKELQKSDLRIVNIQGGDKHNAIPRHAAAAISIPGKSLDPLKHIVETCSATFKNRFPEETGLSISCKPAEHADSAIPDKDSIALIDMLLAFPNGILTMSRAIPGLVETSNNLASVKMKENTVVIHNAPRSSVSESLDAVVKRICAVAESAGAEVFIERSYPGWQPDRESRLLRIAQKVHTDLFGKAAAIKAVHAGLECGIIKTRYPDMDMISIGPDIRHAHSPREAVDIESVRRFQDYLTGILKAIAETQPL